MKIPKYILPIIIVSQFCCTSLWFAGNGVLKDLIVTFQLAPNALGHLTTAVQLGFIFGTLFFALFTITDRISPSVVFLGSAILGGFFNFLVILENQTLTSLMLYRFFTGFFLAGIYPVGMKIATDYFNKGLGKSLGFIVGALVLGTALPHLLKEVMQDFNWRSIMKATSLLSLFGGFLLFLFVKDGPFRKKSKELNLKICLSVFKNVSFRKAAFGYFGHMWELYTFWAFIPVLLELYSKTHQNVVLNIPLLTFSIIGIGFLSCILSGILSVKYGTYKTAFTILALSCGCCLLAPFLFLQNSTILFVLFLGFWSMVVIADSPLFSTLVAQNAPAKDRGTALTIVNCIGFSITIISIQFLNYLFQIFNNYWVFSFLAVGPILGLFALRKQKLYQN